MRQASGSCREPDNPCFRPDWLVHRILRVWPPPGLSWAGAASRQPISVVEFLMCTQSSVLEGQYRKLCIKLYGFKYLGHKPLCQNYWHMCPAA